MRFYGRGSELNQVCTRLLNAEFESTSIVGERRTGKTSLLKILQHPETLHRYGLDPTRYIFVYVDLTMIDERATPTRFWQRVLRQVGRNVEVQEIHELIEEARSMEVVDTWMLDDVFYEVDDNGLNVVLVLDEFENVTRNANFGPDFFYGLRALAIHHRLALVTASRQELIETSHSQEVRASPFFNIFATIHLYQLELDDARSLITGSLTGSGVAFTPDEVEYVLRIAGQHPFFLQIAAHYLYESYLNYANDLVARKQNVLREFQAEAHPHFEHYWRNSESSERIILTALALLELQALGQRLPQHIQMTDLYDQAEPVMARLERRSLLTHDGDPYRLSSAALADWIVDEFAAFSADQSDFAAWQAEHQDHLQSIAPEVAEAANSILPGVRAEYRLLVLHWLSHAQDPTVVEELLSKPHSGTRLTDFWMESTSPDDTFEPQAEATPEPLPPVATRPPAARTETAYADFDVKVERVDSTSVRALVLNSPAGQGSVTCALPFPLEGIGEVMVDLGRHVTRGEEGMPGQVTPVAIGEALFEVVFSGAVGDLFFESLGIARSREQGLRVKIHLDPEESPYLAALPWEYLYNNRRRLFLSLSRLTPVIRYLDVWAPTAPPRINPPLRVLVALASPVGLQPLNLAREQDSIHQAWGGRDDVAVDYLDPATPSALHAQLWDLRPHVLHFMGHGRFDADTGAGALLFVDDRGNPAPVNGTQLGVLLSNAPSVRLAFLNACQSAELSRSPDLDPFSGVAAALVMAGLPAVVAMQFPISDRAALTFADRFYPRIAGGDPVDVAVAFGREALHLEMNDTHEWGTPVLFMRVPDGRLFDLDGETQMHSPHAP